VLEVSVGLDGPNALPITPGIPRSLVLDFDLEASNAVSFPTPGAPVLTVRPLLLAEVEKASIKVQRLRGPLQAVNTANGTFHVFIKPFYARLVNGTRPFGSVRVATGPDTLYEIDGESYSGGAGLQALALKDRLTAVIVRGGLRFKPMRFEATEVYAGASVPGGELDVVTGSVVARSEDTVTLRGVTLMRANATVVFNDAVSVQLAPSTTVKRQLSLDDFDMDDISVGQRLLVFGTLTDDRPDAMSLDAANGYARILFSDLRGEVVTNDDTPAFDLHLSRINGRSVAIYDFTGTGTDPAHDADPDRYELATSTLDVSGVSVGASVHVKGFARPFGQAPKDFDATAVAYPPTN
jgi:hypothetical protein